MVSSQTLELAVHRVAARHSSYSRHLWPPVCDVAAAAMASSLAADYYWSDRPLPLLDRRQFAAENSNAVVTEHCSTCH